MKLLAALYFVVGIGAATAFAQSSQANDEKNPYNGEAFIALCLQKTDWIVVGTFKRPVEEGVGIGGGRIGKPGEPVLGGISVTADVEVREIIKGGPLLDQPLLIELCYFVTNEGIKPNVGSVQFDPQAKDLLPKYERDKKYIFFLQKYPPGDTTGANGRVCTARTTDPWFGVLPYSEAFALALRQAVSAAK